MLKNNIKIALRYLTKYKTYSIINIVGLSVGIASAILTLLWIQYEMSFDKFHENAEKLYRVVFTMEKEDYHGFYQPGPLAIYLQDNYPEIKFASSYSEIQWKMSRETKGYFCKGAFVDSSFFKMFSFDLEYGNPGEVLTRTNSVVISHSTALRVFGESNPVGKTLKLNDSYDAYVTGVFTDVPNTSSIQFDFVVPFNTAPEYTRMWDRKCTNTYVLLHDNASLDEINRKISGLMDERNPEWRNKLYLFPFVDNHLFAPGGGGAIIYIYIFFLFSLIVLIVACINFVNLSTARSQQRMKEIGIKKTVGSTRFDLIKQFMTETVLFTFVSLLSAIVIVEMMLPYLNNILGTYIAVSYSGITILFLISVSLLTGVIAGSYPAVYLSSLKPIMILKDNNSKIGKSRSSLLRNTLVVLQFSFSVFIITCVLIIGRQLNYIQSKDLGFNKEQVLLISTRGDLQRHTAVIKSELIKLPNVESVTVSATDLTGFQAGSGPIEWEGKSQDKICEVGFNYVDEDFMRTCKIEMQQGRFFSKEYPTDMKEAFVVNETTVKKMGIKDPLNKNIKTWYGRKGKIIGVMKDFNTQSLRETMAPVVYIMTPASNYLFVRIFSKDYSSTISSIESKIKEIVPNDPFEYRFLDEQINSLYESEQKTSKFAGIIAVLAIFISCLGLFGLASFSGEQRTKEVGVRKVLGASINNIILMFTSELLKWIVLANIIAWPIVYIVMNQWLQNFAYRININLWVFLLAGGTTLLIALATVSFQAIKAAMANPVESLKYE